MTNGCEGNKANSHSQGEGDIDQQGELAGLYRKAAKEMYEHEGETEIDGEAVVSHSDEGAYVQAWVWVGKDQADGVCRTCGGLANDGEGYDGECGNCADKSSEGQYTNHFYHCGQQWDDTWSCQCNDECPVCGCEIEPYASTDNTDTEGGLQIHNQAVYKMAEDGLPCCKVCGDAECNEHPTVGGR